MTGETLFHSHLKLVLHLYSWKFMESIVYILQASIRVVFGRILKKDSVSPTKLIKDSVNRSNSGGD